MAMTVFLASLMRMVEGITGIPVAEGYFDGPLEDGQTDIGCAYIPGVREDHDTTREFVDARIRLFKVYVAPSEQTSPLTLTPLYDLIESVQAAFGEDQTQVDGVWFARLTEAEINHKQYGVEMQFIGFAWNPANPVAPQT